MADTPISALPRLDHDNPWPGLASFAEADRAYFHGRDAEAAELHARVQRETLTVLFGRSGLGKSSLLNAGLFPLLREEDFLPVYIRLDHSDSATVKRQVRRALGPLKYAGHEHRNAVSLRVQVLSALREACASHQIEAPTPEPDETLWAFFHRSDSEFWSARNRPVTPVLVFDQFEELFSLGQGDSRARERCEAFIAELGDLIENRVPAALKAQLDSAADSDSNVALGHRYDFRSRSVKLIVSFREDFLADMEGLKRPIPSLMHNRFRLQPMSGVQAYEVVNQSGGHLVDKLMARRIIGLAGRGTPEPPPTVEELPELEIDPALLSVVCSELNVKRQRLGDPRIAAHLLEGAEREILSDFYERGFEGLDPRVRVFVEDNLLTASGFRNSYARDDALTQPGLTAEALATLVERRLVREDERFGARRLELTHDILTRVVQDSRDARKAREAEALALAREHDAAKKQRRNRVMGAALAMGIATVLAGCGYVWHLKVSASRLLKEAHAMHLLSTADRMGKQNTDLALLLNKEAFNSVPSLESRAGLISKLQGTNPLLAYLHGSNRAINSVAYSPDSNMLVSASDDHGMIVWDISSGKRLARLDGHKNSVRHVTFSPNGTIFASASTDATVIVWNARTRQRVAVLDAHKNSVLYLAFSPDGKTLATASDDNTVMLWDTITFARLATLEGHNNWVRHVAFSPDGKTLVSSSNDNSLILWDIATRKLITRLDGHRRSVAHAAFSPSGKTLVSASIDSTIMVWDITSYRRLSTLKGHKNSVIHVAFSPDGKTFASASDDDKVIVWDAIKYTQNIVLDGHRDTVFHIAFSPDGRVLASASHDNTVILWDAKTYARLKTLEGHRDSVRQVVFSPDGKTLASASNDNTVILWDAGVRSRHSLDGHTRSVRRVSFSPTGNAIASASNDNTVMIWNTSTRKPVATLSKHSDWILHTTFSPDGKTLASASIDSTAMLWNAATHAHLATLKGHARSVAHVSFSPDGKMIATASDDTMVMLWDTYAGKRIATLEGHNSSVVHVIFSPDGKIVASASNDGTVILWDAITRIRIAVLQGHKNWVRYIAFSPDSKILVSASNDHSLKLWNVSTHKPIGILEGHKDAVLNVAFSPDSKTLASASKDNTVMLWDSNTRTRLATLEGHKHWVNHVTYSPDGKSLASASNDNIVMLWDTTTRARLVTLEGHNDYVTHVTFSPDGKILASSSADRTIILWNWDADRLATDACRTANRNLTCGEWRQYLGQRPYAKTCPALPGPDKCD